MKVGPLEVEQILGTVRCGDLVIQMPDGAHRRWDEFPPTLMRGEHALYQETVIEVGVQRKINMKPLRNVDREIQQLFNECDFFKVTLVAHFSPRRNLKFVSGTLQITLRNSANGQAIIYSIAPLRVDDTRKRTKRFGVAPDLKLFDIELNPGIERISETSYEEIHPQIIGYFAAGSWAAWEYRTTEITREIVGTQIMEFVVKQPIGLVSKAQVEVEGNVNWRNLSARFKGFLIGELKPDVPSPNFATFTIP